MSLWEDLDIANKVTQILSDVPDADSAHQLGRSYLTAYQLAIEYAKRHPDDVKEIGYGEKIGTGTGQHNSLAQYLALQLSRNIKAKKLPDIEGGFLSNLHLENVRFQYGTEIIQSSLTGTNYTLSMFRLKA